MYKQRKFHGQKSEPKKNTSWTTMDSATDSNSKAATWNNVANINSETQFKSPVLELEKKWNDFYHLSECCQH